MRQSALAVNQYSVHNHYGVVDEHTHRYDESPERYALQSGAPCQKDRERYGYCKYKSEAYYHATTQTHGENQHENHDCHRFHKVDHKRIDCLRYLVGLEEYLFGLQSGGHVFHRFGKTRVHSLPDIRHDGVGFHGNADGESRFAVNEESVVLGLGEPSLNLGNVAEAYLFPGRGAYKEVAYVVFVLHCAADAHRDAFVSAMERSGVHFLAGVLQ